MDMEEGILEAVRVTWAYRTGGSQKNGSASLNLREDPDSRLPDLSPDQPLRTYEIIAIVIVFLIFFAIPAAITACIRKRTTRYNLFKKHEVKKQSSLFDNSMCSDTVNNSGNMVFVLVLVTN